MAPGKILVVYLAVAKHVEVCENHSLMRKKRELGGTNLPRIERITEAQDWDPYIHEGISSETSEQ